LHWELHWNLNLAHRVSLGATPYLDSAASCCRSL
jgi:hypothetical protein